MSLIVDVSNIPPEGLEIQAPLNPGEVHLDGEKAFALKDGGTLACRLEVADDATVHVRGHLQARLGLECGGCLEAFEFPIDQSLDLFYLPHREDDVEEDEEELDDREVVVAYYRDGRLDLGEMVREQFFLSLPMRLVCREECRGLCPTCGANRNLVSCNCPGEESGDPRLAPLARFLRKGSS